MGQTVLWVVETFFTCTGNSAITWLVNVHVGVLKDFKATYVTMVFLDSRNDINKKKWLNGDMNIFLKLIIIFTWKCLKSIIKIYFLIWYLKGKSKVIMFGYFLTQNMTSLHYCLKQDVSSQLRSTLLFHCSVSVFSSIYA